MVHAVPSLEPSATEVPPSHASVLPCVRALAARDAGVILGAIESNLDWLERSVKDSRNDSSNGLLFESLQVCRQLLGLLGGAIGSCADIPQTDGSRMHHIPCALLVDRTKELIASVAGPERVSVSGWPPEDLTVNIDPEAMDSVLQTVAGEATKCCDGGGGVEIFASRSGRHALIGISVGLSAMATRPTLTESAAAGLSSGIRQVLEASPGARTLLDQGGFLDAEVHPDGGMTFYMVLPWEESSGRATNIGTRIAEGEAEVPTELRLEVEPRDDDTE